MQTIKQTHALSLSHAQLTANSTITFTNSVLVFVRQRAKHALIIILFVRKCMHVRSHLLSQEKARGMAATGDAPSAQPDKWHAYYQRGFTPWDSEAACSQLTAGLSFDSNSILTQEQRDDRRRTMLPPRDRELPDNLTPDAPPVEGAVKELYISKSMYVHIYMYIHVHKYKFINLCI